MKTINKVIADLVKKMEASNKDVAEKLGITPQAVGLYIDGKRTPGSDIITKWKKAFGDDLTSMVIEYETGVSRGATNETERNADKIRGEVMLDLVEKNERYRLVPTLILDKYEILSNRELEDRAQVLRQLLSQAQEISATKDVVIQSKNDLIQELKDEIEELRSLKKGSKISIPSK